MINVIIFVYFFKMIFTKDSYCLFVFLSKGRCHDMC